MTKMGGIGGLMSMLPGIGKIKNQLAERNLDDSVLKRQMAIIDSMTPGERKHPDVLKASRKKRIAAGSGTKVEEINKLLKMHRTMADMMKVMGGGKARGPMAGLAQAMGLGSGMPSPEEMAKLAQKHAGRLARRTGRRDCRRTCRACRSFRAVRDFRRSARPGRRQAADARRPAAGFFREEEMKRHLTVIPNASNVRMTLKGRTYNARRHPPGPRRNQEAAGLSHRRSRQPRRRATAASSSGSATSIRCCRRTSRSG